MRPDSTPSHDPRIDELSRRIAAIEERLGMAAPPARSDRPAIDHQAAHTSQRVSVHPPLAPAPAVVPPTFSDQTGGLEAIAPPPAPNTAPPVFAPPVFAPPRAAPRAAPSFNLEKFVGLRLFTAVGALGLVIGVVLFLKLAIDSGWLRMPPAARCVGAAAFGFVLLGLGEVARRRISALASAGLSAAGIGTIYGAVWVAYARFELVGDAGAFVLLAASSALGIAVAARANLLSVAIVSLAGAYLAPIIAATEDPAPVVFPAYLLALVALGLGLSALRPRPFRPMRALVWWATVVLGTGAAFVAADAGQPLISLAFLALFWAAVHAELWHATRGGTARGDDPPRRGVPWRTARPILTTFGTTMWCAAVGVWSLGWAGSAVATPPDWSVTAALVLGSGAIALVLAGNLRALIDTPRTDAERLGAALMAQAGALVVATVALALDDSAQVQAGVAIGVAGVFAGRWINARALDVYGLIVLALTLARLVLFDSWASGVAGPGTVGRAFVGLNITTWTLLMLGAAAGWCSAGALMVRRSPPGAWRAVGSASLAVALGAGYASLVSPHADGGSVAWAWFGAACAVLALHLALPRVALDLVGLGGLCGSVAAWSGVYALRNWNASALPIGLHPGLLLALAQAGAFAVAAWWLRRPRAAATTVHVVPAAAGIAIALAFAATSLEVRRAAHAWVTDPTAQHAALSIWWGLFAIGLIVAGFVAAPARRGRSPVAIVRHAGLALMTVAAIKVVIVDSAEVADLWRIVVFLCLGVMMLGVAVGYAKVAATLDRAAAPPQE